MHARDVLRYGHRTLLGAIEGLPAADWRTKGVTGVWSAKDVIAHLDSHEQAFVEILERLLGQENTPTLDRFKRGVGEFNDPEVAGRQSLSAAAVLDAYQRRHARTLELIERIPEATLRQTGLLPWYGAEYDLEDFIAYGVYGHKREHAAQIAAYRDRIKR